MVGWANARLGGIHTPPVLAHSDWILPLKVTASSPYVYARISFCLQSRGLHQQKRVERLAFLEGTCFVSQRS